MAYTINHIAKILNAKNAISSNTLIEHLLIDSRKIIHSTTSLFFALQSNRRDGHSFIKELYEKGVLNFVVKTNFEVATYPNANFIFVDDVLNALQTIVAYHRSQFSIPVIGITGSNGKTIVKEWLNQLLLTEYNIARSPRSYNSQIGVPLSVWQLSKEHTLGIFEAGISTKNEMNNLEKIIQPTIGLLTNIGEAHSEGFKNVEEKIQEKIQLFKHCKQVVFCEESITQFSKNIIAEHFSWSRKNKNATVFVLQENKNAKHTTLSFNYKKQTHQTIIPFTDAASIENSIHCICTLLLLNFSVEEINKRIIQLQAVEMRMQLKKAVNNSYVLNDSYSNDISSLHIALDYLQQQAGNNQKIVILSDILQSSTNYQKLYTEVAATLAQHNVNIFIGIGENICKHQSLFLNIHQSFFFYSTNNFLENFTHSFFKDSFILLKGARIFGFEKINKWLEQKTHQTVLEINLSALAHNLKMYQQQLLPTTKIMAMVKAFSYGSGSTEIARLLAFHKIDYLAVAYTDEGVDLRNAGISLPIMVMNIDEESFDALIEYNLEPEIYSFNIYYSFCSYLKQQAISKFPVHIKVNTGMNRLGFEPEDAVTLFSEIKNNQSVFVKSIFSHLVASESAEHNEFTKHQSVLFESFCLKAKEILNYNFLKHIANTAAASKHKTLQYDMVRLGIGLYGIDNNHTLNLQPVATLKTTIAQIRKIKAGESVGYNRNGVVKKDSLIATIRIGYADGFNRKMSNGNGFVMIQNKLAPVIGNVCMDMTMIDITEIDNVLEGDIVEIFGTNLSVEKVAKWCNTIAYEVMTSISQRVKRIYIEE
ncbi:MAG: bifunctional UDP-N-acetylmuramoyl-tripeptide:D-alanyl-D-alanine ligase/alanine racemase [Bacteroidetes bacterium]|nr:bifunctional UDP-N-acetylmuramoyl-tripeptide:D-alanyl-D-alanine ligase/alanine racemase [Bacteroidota bacterium]